MLQNKNSIFENLMRLWSEKYGYLTFIGGNGHESLYYQRRKKDRAV